MDNSNTSTPPKKKRVGFTPEGPLERSERPNFIALPSRATLSPPFLSPAQISPSESVFFSGNHSRNTSSDALIVDPGRSHLPQVSAEVTDQIRAAFSNTPAKPRPVLRRGDSASSATPDTLDINTVQDVRAREAHERGKRLELDERIRSGPSSRRQSPSGVQRPKYGSDIPLEEFAVQSDDEGKPIL